MGTTQTRKEKIEWLRKTIKEFWKACPKEKIDGKSLAIQFAMFHNSTMRTGMELLEMLETEGKIIIDKNWLITRATRRK